MADVFAFYDCSDSAPPGQAAMVTLWARGWTNRGWNPRLITARHARRSKFYWRVKHIPDWMPFLALHAVGGEWLSSLKVMNFSFDPHTARRGTREHYDFGNGVIEVAKIDFTRALRLGRLSLDHDKNHCCKYDSEHRSCCKYNRESWLNFPLVYFPDPSYILTCGRSL